MTLEEYQNHQELRIKINTDIKDLWVNTPTEDKLCYGCIDFEHHPVHGAGAPERQSYTKCGLFNETWECNNDKKKVFRTIQCLLSGYKTIK